MKEKANMKSKIIVTGGGSGGHVSCASAIIEELATRYNLTEENFLYIGGDLGMEGENKSESLEKRYLLQHILSAHAGHLHIHDDHIHFRLVQVSQNHGDSFRAP